MSTLRLMLHLRAREKLGGGSRVLMLFPPAALDHFERQKQTERSEAEVKHYRPAVHHATGEIVHMLGQRQVSEKLRLPSSLHGEGRRKITQQKKGYASGNADDGGDDLASGNGRGQAT